MEGDDADVESFIKFSLSVQNRRKSRAGRALEHHVSWILDTCGILKSHGAETENKSKPDFILPGIDEYHNLLFPAAQLSMLGVKSTCKDRWRQVLSEAQRIPFKHLLTLEPGISENQTSEMQANNLQLVLPRSLHETYKPEQQSWLIDFKTFIRIAAARQIK